MTVESVVDVTAELEGTSPKRRRCYLPQEKELKLFPFYSDGNCILECAWQMALDKCGCAPWFLVEPLDAAKMCDVGGNACFRAVVENRLGGGEMYLPCLEECLPDCKRITYLSKNTGFSKYSQRLQYEKFKVDQNDVVTTAAAAAFDDVHATSSTVALQMLLLL